MLGNGASHNCGNIVPTSTRIGFFFKSFANIVNAKPMPVGRNS